MNNGIAALTVHVVTPGTLLRPGSCSEQSTSSTEPAERQRKTENVFQNLCVVGRKFKCAVSHTQALITCKSSGGRLVVLPLHSLSAVAMTASSSRGLREQVE